jgi:organic radical activating enzyme
MELVSVENNWDAETLRIDITLGNICNYKCWYCFPGAHAGTDYWPDIELMKKNITHLINYYKKHANKKKFDFYFIGGEPTHWPKLIELVTFLKDNFNCLINMTSNGSKKIEYWEKIAPYFNRITLSCHHEYVKLEHFRDVADLLYEKNVVVSVSMMMDPYKWEKSLLYIDFLKKSRHKWAIRYAELLGHSITYTEEQRNFLLNHKARNANIFWFFKNNKHYLSKVKVIDDAGKKHKFKDNEILARQLNHFNGWMCSLGINWVHIPRNGKISGTCGQIPYDTEKEYNFYSETFEIDFDPMISHTTCKVESCDCGIETVMPKYKVSKWT